MDFPILRHVIDRADEALSGGSHRAADLRYGHDIGLVPLCTLMRLAGFDRVRDFNEAADNWNTSAEVCMAANLQLVFFAPKKALSAGEDLSAEDVLVKFLYNEKETGIPALTPVSGPYYRWSEVRAFWKGLMGE